MPCSPWQESRDTEAPARDVFGMPPTSPPFPGMSTERGPNFTLLLDNPLSGVPTVTATAAAAETPDVAVRGENDDMRMEGVRCACLGSRRTTGREGKAPVCSHSVGGEEEFWAPREELGDLSDAVKT
uniref:Uncharacterized protein n=1 Tax=Chromera velia CCMP2878 TaxID=1169474 RepID=A0A0G4IFX5_9ALVE|eukprot:Cvel_14141.t1-p1 / transcript=Cvel_14141.t1 / gene=Cvel_14141 / organism=Chromera_velia_CCMP2878 / gene_product=hypothetical protein / transcript_product=hypothetical protein / location=Cvel_scaffold996:40392-40769(-) / protein_length=126 / sequence_SO=supercontig / SO=protein_coding / is_pseudo=false